MISALATRRQGRICLCALASAAALAVLYRVPPGEGAFYPTCPIHQYTGLLCPGCGSTRALHALLHGHLGEAIHLNALLILIVLPTLLLYLAASLRQGSRVRIGTPAIIAAGILTTLFTIARNLPGTH